MWTARQASCPHAHRAQRPAIIVNVSFHTKRRGANAAWALRHEWQAEPWMRAGLDSIQIFIELQHAGFRDRSLLRRLRARRELTRGQGFSNSVQYLLEREAFLLRPDVPEFLKRVWPI